MSETLDTQGDEGTLSTPSNYGRAIQKDCNGYCRAATAQQFGKEVHLRYLRLRNPLPGGRRLTHHRCQRSCRGVASVARVVPEEILTDQGTNFTSQLLREVYGLLQIDPIRTTPYHPQTDGLVERFNSTLKAMLKKTAAEKGKDCDPTYSSPTVRCRRLQPVSRLSSWCMAETSEGP